MQIIILDGYTTNPGDLSWESIAAQGTLSVYDRTAPDDVIERIGNAEIVFTNKTVLPADLFDQCPSIRFLGLLSTGYNVVDIDYARRKNVTVCNIPAYSTDSVAQLTIALLLELCHHVGAHSRGVLEGEWVKSVDFCYWHYPLTELRDKTLGLIGFGDTGSRVAAVAAALGMHILYTNGRGHAVSSPYTYAPVDTLLRSADVVSLHCPLTDRTRGLISADAIGRMKDGAFLINTARGDIVNESAVRHALDSGKLGGFAADVSAHEPMSADSPLLGAPNCFITPHIAWATPEARKRLIAIAAENLRLFLLGTPQNVVNP